MATKKKTDTETIAENEKRYNRFVEGAKFRSDYLKHIATLDTGSIVILVTFLQKPASPGLGSVIAFALLCLVVSLVAVVATQNILMHQISKFEDDLYGSLDKAEKNGYSLLTFIAYGSFVLGLSLLGVFVFYNLAIL